MKKILIVEDDEFFAKVYGVKLEQDGVKMIYLIDGTNVVETAKKEKPSVIALDLVMPNKDGYKVLTDLQNDAETKNIPVVVITSRKSDSDIAKCKELGVKDFLAKSEFSLKDLEQTLQKYL